MTSLVAVDWSGAKSGAAQHIWLAEVHRGRLAELANGRTREDVVQHLIALRKRCADGLVVGFDFSFSLPAWFLRQRGHSGAPDLWRQVTREGETWLTACEPPFWGKPRDRRPDLAEHLRRTERAAEVGGIRAKSTFQLRGAGTVGTGSLRGMPHLLELQAAGFSIWPFDAPSPFAVVEVYPRLCTGPVHKRNGAARAEYLRQEAWDLTPRQRDQMVGSEDAFDAAITALVMRRHVESLRRLRQATDVDDLLEGRIWNPHKIEA